MEKKVKEAEVKEAEVKEAEVKEAEVKEAEVKEAEVKTKEKLQRKLLLDPVIWDSIDLLARMKISFEENTKIQAFLECLNFYIKDDLKKRDKLRIKYHGMIQKDQKIVFNQPVDQQRYSMEYGIYLDEEIEYELVIIKTEKVIPLLYRTLKNLIKFVPLN